MSESLARFVVRRRGWIAVGWAVAAALIVPHARTLPARLEASTRVGGRQSDSVARLLVDRFASPFARSAILVVTGVPSPRLPSGESALREIVHAVVATPGVIQTLSFLDGRDSTFVGMGGETFVLVGLDTGSAVQLVPHLRKGTASVAAAMSLRHQAARLSWTGDDALIHDLRRASAADVSSAERRALPLTIVLLLLAFGAVGAAAIPLTVGSLAIALALGVASLASRAFPLAIVLQSVVSMLGLGLGIDYSLLLVSRFREARKAGLAAPEAAVEAGTTAGHSVLVSAGAVLVGFAALLIVPLADLRSIAVGGLLVVTTSALLAVTLVPGLLAWLGHRIDVGRAWPRRRMTRASQRWRRWAVFVARHPVRTLVVAGLPLVVLAAQTRRLSSTLPSGDWLPRSAEASRGAEALRAMQRAGVVQGLRVVIAFPRHVSALDSAAWAATQRLATTLSRDARVGRVRSLPAIASGAKPHTMLYYLIPDFVRRTFVSRDEQLAMLEVVPAEGVDGAALPALARDLRTMDAARASGLPGVRVLVGGLPAFNADYADTITARTPLVIALVLGGIFLALVCSFRSVLVPLKAIVLNAVVVAAALGVVVLVFQDGIGARVLGLSGPLDGTFAAVPLLVFCVVFGLSIDYEVFLISRVAEARARGASEGAALVSGVARTGRVITSAAAIMVAVFAAFALGDFVLVKILGVALAAAVVLDATLVRLAVAPALLAIAGRFNWWPGVPSAAGVSAAIPRGVPRRTARHERPRRA